MGLGGGYETFCRLHINFYNIVVHSLVKTGKRGNTKVKKKVKIPVFGL